jgi:alpha-glucosidase (family GH31 glycosyl hydrolase)
MQGKLLRQTLDKFLKAPVAQEARVQVVLPNGEFYDIEGVQLLENIQEVK